MHRQKSTLIRMAQKNDLPFIVKSQLLMAEETEQLILDQQILLQGVSAVLDDSSKGIYYIAMVEDVPRGMLLTVPEWSDWRNGTVLWIHSVYVEKNFRKLGIFKELYQHIQNKVLLASDLRGIRLYVDKRNIHAQVIYQHLGMNKEHYELFEWLK